MIVAERVTPRFSRRLIEPAAGKHSPSRRSLAPQSGSQQIRRSRPVQRDREAQLRASHFAHELRRRGWNDVAALEAGFGPMVDVTNRLSTARRRGDEQHHRQAWLHG
jgi:hypothetical protein